MIPHFRVPLAFSDAPGRAALTVEQDTLEEVGAAVEAVLRYQPGLRSVRPDFGIEDLAFLATMPEEAMAEEIGEQEPRIEVLIESEIDLEDFVARVRVEVPYESGEGL